MSIVELRLRRLVYSLAANAGRWSLRTGINAVAGVVKKHFVERGQVEPCTTRLPTRIKSSKGIASLVA